MQVNTIRDTQTSSKAINWMIAQSNAVSDTCVFGSFTLRANMRNEIIAWFKANNGSHHDGSVKSTRCVHHAGLRLTVKMGSRKSNAADVSFWAELLTPEELAYDAERTSQTVSYWAD